MEANVREELENLVDDIQSEIEVFLKWCESPIEQLLLLTFIKYERPNFEFDSPAKENERRPVLQHEFGPLVPQSLYWHRSRKAGQRSLCQLIPQFHIRDEFERVIYRIDFALFHARTDGKGDLKIKEQAKKDKAEDRYLQSEGWVVARFTGSEIFKDPFKVYMDIYLLTLAKDRELWNDSEKTGS
jgi:very-short-patch-repair endonuclease